MSLDIYRQGCEAVEKMSLELIDVHNRCVNHPNSKESYASPSFSEWKSSALTVDDMPMHTYIEENIEPVRNDQDSVPWQDSIKNLIFDMRSISTSSRFLTCILLSDVGYRYQEATIYMIASKYGKDSVTLIDVFPCDYYDKNTYDEFNLRIQSKTLKYESRIQVDTLASHLGHWYEPHSTIIFCHDSSITQYQSVISMMPQSIWSISCGCSNFIVSSGQKSCKYVLPNYACAGSFETRAVGTGPVSFTAESAPANYIGKLNYYSRCIRASRHFSGKCYDCKILEKTVNSFYKSPESTPTTTRTAIFSSMFDKINKRTSGIFSDSGYGSNSSDILHKETT